MPGQRFAFVLRLWIEEDAGGRLALRGSIQQVSSAEVHYFSGLEQVPALLREVMAGQAKRSMGQDG